MSDPVCFDFFRSWANRRARRFVVFAAMLLAGLGIADSSPITRESVLVIDHVAVVDVVAGTTRLDQRVVIAADRIQSVGPAAKIELPPDAVVLDGTGKFLIPGLWDMHIHWYDRSTMQLFPLNGVTGVRIMFGSPMHDAWRNQFESGDYLGPRLLVGSPIIDGTKPIWPGSFEVHEPAQAKDTVARAVAMHSDFLKVYSLLSREAYFAVAEEAKAAGIPFAGHVPMAVSIREAAEAGQSSMEHLYEIFIATSTEEETLRQLRADAIEAAGNVRGYYENRELAKTINRRAMASFDEQKARALFELLAAKKAWQCPTLTVLRNLAFLETDQVQQNPDLKYFQPAVRAMLAPKKDKQGRSAEDFAFSQDSFRKHLKLLKPMHDAGVPLLAGTDCLNPFCLPGFSLHDELALLQDAGLTPAEALRTATCNPATFQKRESDLGSIDVGKFADLVLLQANPLDDIRHTRQIEAVILRGRLLDQATRVERLQALEKAATPN